MTSSRKNLWTAILGAGLCVVLITTISLLSVDSAGDFISRRPSTFFSDRTGTRALLLILQQLIPTTDLWRRPLIDLPAESGTSRSTLIVMGPEEALTESEVRALDKWISSGGQLILATSKEWQIRKRTNSEKTDKKPPKEPAKAGKENEDYSPQGFLARHNLTARADISGADATAGAALVDLGSGRIVFVSDSYAFSNQTLRGTENALWMADRTSEWSNTETARVLIDEYHHGFGDRRSLVSLIGAFLVLPWGFMTMQLALAGIIFLLGTRRRFGRPVEELPVERTSPIETVEALGGLFEAAEARALCVRSIHQYLNLQLSGLFGYTVDISNPAIRERIADRSSTGRNGLEAYAKAVKHVIDSETASDGELIRIAREATKISRSFSHGHSRQHSRRTAAAG